MSSIMHYTERDQNESLVIDIMSRTCTEAARLKRYNADQFLRLVLVAICRTVCIEQEPSVSRD